DYLAYPAVGRSVSASAIATTASASVHPSASVLLAHRPAGMDRLQAVYVEDRVQARHPEVRAAPEETVDPDPRSPGVAVGLREAPLAPSVDHRGSRHPDLRVGVLPAVLEAQEGPEAPHLDWALRSDCRGN
ncbi:MAG: hypothetical protein V3W37_06195, partial [Candidatus Binatia bacterium]